MKTLSDKIKDLSVYMDWGNEPTYDMDDDKNGNWLSVSDVKQFIKEIKKSICSCRKIPKKETMLKKINIEMNKLCEHHIINKLAGKELIE